MLFQILALIFMYVCNSFGQVRIPQNPCKNIFSYRSDNGYYYGEVRIPYDGNSRLVFNLNVSMVGIYNNDLNLKLTLLTPTDSLSGSIPTNQLLYRVDFPLQNILPKITQIEYNGNIYCSGPPEPLSTQGITNLWSQLRHFIYTTANTIPWAPPVTFSTSSTTTPSYDTINHINPSLENNPWLAHLTSSTSRYPNYPTPPIETTPSPFTSPIASPTPPRSDFGQCGIVNNVINLAINGESTRDGEFPWLVAVYHLPTWSDFNFVSTGVLISDRHVLTVAHPYRYNSIYLIPLEKMIVVMGTSKLQNLFVNGVTSPIKKDFVHSNFQQGRSEGDLAILELENKVEFSEKIRPICLWDSSLNNFVDQKGIVAGWDTDDDRKNPKQYKLNMPIIAEETCKRRDTQNLITDLTYCAGRQDGSGSCTNTGAPMIIKRGRQWYLKGILTFGIEQKCNLKNYFVFADVTKSTNWVKSSIK